jgi:hypothetical protein
MLVPAASRHRRVIRPPSKAALTFLRATAGRSKGSGIFSSISVCRPRSLCCFGQGIMPHICLSDHVLRFGRVDEAIE